MTHGLETTAFKAARSAIIEILADKNGFILVEGASGSGKSLLKKQLQDKLSQHYDLINLPYSRFDVDELLTTIAESLRLPYQQDDSDSCFLAVQKHAKHQLRSGKPVALLVDDGQFIPADTLSALAKAISGDDPLIPLRGVIFSAPGVHQQLVFSHIEQQLLSKFLILSPANELEMKAYIDQQLQQAGGDFRIGSNALQDLLLHSAGSFRNAQRLVKLAVNEARFSGGNEITENIVELVLTEKGLNHSEPSTDLLGNSDGTSAHRPNELELLNQNPGFDPTLGGLLTASLLDTPKKPQLKSHSEQLNTPLFLNDLAAPEVSIQSALYGDPAQAQAQAQQKSLQAEDISATAADNLIEDPESDALNNPSVKPVQDDTEAPASEIDLACSSSQTSELEPAKTTEIANVQQPEADGKELQQMAVDPFPAELHVGVPSPIVLEQPPESNQHPFYLFVGLLVILGLGAFGYLQLAKDPDFEAAQLFRQMKQQLADVVGIESQTTDQPLSQASAATQTGSILRAPPLSQAATAAVDAAPIPEPISTQPRPTQPLAPALVHPDSQLEQTKTAAESSFSPELIPELNAEKITTVTPTKDDLSIQHIEVEEVEAVALEERVIALAEEAQVQADVSDSINSPTPVQTNPTKAADNLTPTNLKNSPPASPTLGEVALEIATSTENRTNSADHIFDDNTNNTESSTGQPQESADSTAIAAREAKIKLLLKQAEIHEKAYRFTIPREKNAVKTFRKVLALVPQHPAALAGISRVTDHYHSRAQRAIKARKWGVAAQNYSRLLLMNANDAKAREGVALLKREMSAAYR
ncbi:MAG: ATP-binding protein [Motiliproteus sp.]